MSPPECCLELELFIHMCFAARVGGATSSVAGKDEMCGIWLKALTIMIVYMKEYC